MNTEPVVKVKKVVENAIVPTTREGDVGYDLYCYANNIITATSTKIHTGISIELPEGYWAQICNRSSMGKHGFTVMGGIIDNAYRGEIMVMLTNPEQQEILSIEHGDKIAQLVIHKENKFGIDLVEELSITKRGESGFGSTGK